MCIRQTKVHVYGNWKWNCNRTSDKRMLLKKILKSLCHQRTNCTQTDVFSFTREQIDGSGSFKGWTDNFLSDKHHTWTVVVSSDCVLYHRPKLSKTIFSIAGINSVVCYKWKFWWIRVLKICQVLSLSGHWMETVNNNLLQWRQSTCVNKNLFWPLTTIIGPR